MNFQPLRPENQTYHTTNQNLDNRLQQTPYYKPLPLTRRSRFVQLVPSTLLRNTLWTSRCTSAFPFPAAFPQAGPHFVWRLHAPEFCNTPPTVDPYFRINQEPQMLDNKTLTAASVAQYFAPHPGRGAKPSRVAELLIEAGIFNERRAGNGSPDLRDIGWSDRSFEMQMPIDESPTSPETG